MEKCYVCRNEVVNGEEITVGPAEHLCEDVVAVSYTHLTLPTTIEV